MHQSRIASLPGRPSRPISSSGSSISSLAELGVLGRDKQEHNRPQHKQEHQHQQHQHGGDGSNNTSTGNSNMMKKLGSKFALKRRHDNTNNSTRTKASINPSDDHDTDSIEELADEEDDNSILATARPSTGRILTASNSSSSSARPPSLYGDLTQSGSRLPASLRHRSSLSNLNGSTSSHHAGTSGGSALRQPGTLRHRASISSLSSSHGSDIGTTSPPSTVTRTNNTLRHRSSISSMSSLASNSNSNDQQPPVTATRIRTISSIATTARSNNSGVNVVTTHTNTSNSTSSSTTSTSTSARSSNKIVSPGTSGTLNNSRRLSATHTGLASLRTRTTSLMSPPSTASTGHRIVGQGNAGDVSVANASSHGSGSLARRQGIPKSSTTSMVRPAGVTTSIGTSMIASQSKRLGSVTGITRMGGTDMTTPKAATVSNSSRHTMIRSTSDTSAKSGGGRKVSQQQQHQQLEDSPGLNELLTNTTMQMADVQDLLSPLAISKTYKIENGNTTSTASDRNGPRQKKENRASAPAPERTSDKMRKSPRNTHISEIKAKAKGEEEYKQDNVEIITSPSKRAAIPLPTHRANSGSSSSPSPSKIRPPTATSPKKTSPSPLADDSSLSTKAAVCDSSTTLNKDGLPILPSTRHLPVPVSGRNSPSKLSPRALPSSPSTKTVISRGGAKESDDDMNNLLLGVGNDGDGIDIDNFTSPSRFLIADSSTILMQNDLSNVMMTPLRAPVPVPSIRAPSLSSSQHALLAKETTNQSTMIITKEEMEALLKAEREAANADLVKQLTQQNEENENRIQQERAEHSRKVAEQLKVMQEKQKEMSSLQKLVSSTANSAVRIAQLEAQLSRQEGTEGNIRYLKRDLSDALSDKKKEEQFHALDNAKLAWKGLSKELEVEKETVGEQLDTLDALRGMLWHISVRMQGMDGHIMV